jgi:hypothetical protein
MSLRTTWAYLVALSRDSTVAGHHALQAVRGAAMVAFASFGLMTEL